jgi:hypothetical protein
LAPQSLQPYVPALGRAAHLVLKRLHDGAPRLLLQVVALHLLNQLLHVRLGLLHDVVDDLHGAWVGNQVADADGEAVLQEPLVDGELDLRGRGAGTGGQVSDGRDNQ